MIAVGTAPSCTGGDSASNWSGTDVKSAKESKFPNERARREGGSPCTLNGCAMVLVRENGTDAPARPLLPKSSREALCRSIFGCWSPAGRVYPEMLYQAAARAVALRAPAARCVRTLSSAIGVLNEAIDTNGDDYKVRTAGGWCWLPSVPRLQHVV